MKKLLFCSFHCYYDTASGAATCERDLTNLLEPLGWECAIISGPQLDFDRGTSIDAFLQESSVNCQSGQTPSSAGPIPVCHIEGERRAVVLSRDGAVNAPPSPQQASQFLQLLAHSTSNWRPDVVLTYGGGEFARVLISHFKNSKIPVVFWLRNHSYYDRRLFAPVDGIVVPSTFTKDLYWQRLAIKCSMIHPPMAWDRLECPGREAKYITFINPQPRKGLYLFAAIVRVMAEKRPRIPFLVVEGMAGSEALARAGLDALKMPNLTVMRHTANPREFYGVTKLLLVPSTAEEPSSRCAAEAQISGLPVIASDRGGLAETVGNGGVTLTVPPALLGESTATPSAADLAPWIDAIQRLWDDEALYARCSEAAVALANTRHPAQLAPIYDAYFRRIADAG